MRNLLNFVPKITLIFGICIICQVSLFAQNYPQDVDLKISLDTELPAVIKINGVFAVQATVSLDDNSSTIPSGETIRARIELLDPDGIAIDSFVQTWAAGFNPNTDGSLSNDPKMPGKVLFQIPWSQADKWTPDAEWKILIQVFAPSVETDLSDNIIERKFSIVVPDLVPTIEAISAVDPLSGELSSAYVPNTNYQVSGRVTNVGQVSTQPGVYLSVLARLLNENGSILDEEIILLGGSNQFNYIESNGGSWEFTIDELFVPPTETGVLSLSLEVNPNTLPGGAAHIEQDYNNNSVSQDVDLNIDNQANENQRPKLLYVPNSYVGERGTFRGMDPAFISFAVRNSGRAPVGPNDYAKASIFLSKDLVVDKGDFVIREFNLSGDGIGLGLLAGDTINLTWNQQLPDNYEGDFYLLIQIENGFYENKNTTSEQLSVSTIETTQLDTTPVFTLLSENHGETRLLLTDPGQSGDSLNQLTAEARGIEQQKVTILQQKIQFPELGYAYDQQIIALNEQLNEVIAQINALASPAERPDVSKDGRFLVFEKKSPIGEGDSSSFPSQQIYLLDMMQPDLPPVLITRRYGTNANPEAANGNSFRPRISYNGDTVVFHSIANDLVPGDTNNKEDVFVYRISTQTMFRAVNSNNEQFNGRSLYPAVNGDGTKIVFESDSTNADLNYSGGGSQIYLWTLDQNASGSGYIRALTKGVGESYNPSIDDEGKRVVFHSYASNLVGAGTDTNNLSDIFLIQLDSLPFYNASFYEIQPYIDGQGNLLDQATFLVNRSYKTEQSTGGHSLNAKISGNGERIIFESKATNLVTGSGIALVEVIEGGGGYQGNPKIEIFDTPGDFNGSGAPGTGAELALKSGGINELQEIDTDAIIVIDPGTGYVSPQVRIIPDPDYPEPTLTAKAVAYLGSPEGDVYYVNVADLNGSNTQPTDSLFSHRISQSAESSGGNFGSRDASIDWNGSTILYSTKSSNLLTSSIRRDDGVNFYNTSFVLPKARAVLVGGIGEIEISSYGIGYEPGTLFIEDLSGSGSGAVASYEVDNLGRIVTIHVIEPGENYNLDSTVVGVVEPRGGTGFEAGTIRFPQTIGEGVTRQGGGRIFSVVIEEHGKGYFIGDADDIFSDIIQFEGDGADLNQDGFPDGRLNPERLKNLDGSLYLEQRFDVDVLSNGPDLANTTLTISDKNNSNDPLVITFGNTGQGSNSHIIISGLSKSEIRDEIIKKIKNELDINSSITDIERNPIIDNNLTAGTSFVFRALSGSFTSSNPSAIQVGLQSNMLIMGSGYSTVTPVVNQVPSIFGFSEVLSNPQFELDGDVGRMTLLSATDYQSDDVYKYDVATAQNERISTSSFGTPVKYLANPSDSVYPSPPSNRFPVISGNGRYAFFSSDTWGNEGLAFITSNQFPQDFNPARDIYLRDLKTTTIIEEDVVSSVDILYPTNNLNHAFSAGSSIPIISDVEYSGVVGRLAVFVNQEFIGNMEEFGGGLGGSYRSGRFSTLLSGLNAGEYSLQLVAYGTDGQVLATSALIRFEVSPYDGSLPPVITMANPSGFSAITSTSVIPISANAEDPDGTISSVSYYVDGQLIKKINRFAGVSETDQSFAMLLDINQTLADGETQGFRTIFAIAEDSSGNFVSSQIHNLSFTKGSTPPAISITRGINGFRLTTPVDINVTRYDSTKGIKSVVLTSGPIGANLIDAKVIVAGTGTGAEIVPIIDLDPLSPDYGKLTDFNVTIEGSGYDADLELSIIPIVRAINEGVRAEVDYIRNQPNDANATTRVDEIRSSVNPDGSLKLGSGYVVAPRLVLEPIGSTIAGNERLQLEQTDAPITKLLPVDLSPILPADSPANRAEIIGGFAQAPIFISIEAIPSDELIESVSLVINGDVDPELVKTFPDLDNTYNFTWVPGDIGDYSVAAIVRDFAGNIVSTEESTISVQNFYGSGVNINLGGTFEYEVEGNGQLFLQVDATSEYDVLEVEFFIDSQSVGRQVSIGSSNFQHVVDLSDPTYNFRQGEHEITIIAYDTKGNIAGTFSRTLTNLQGRINPTLNILPPLIKNKPEVSFVYPLQEIILTQGSTIRLSADAKDSNGDLHGVQFYQVGNPMDAWSGKLDFDNTVPTDGQTLTLYDGTSNAPITFEFDDNFSVFGGGAPAAIPSQSNELNDLSVEGNFTHFKPVDFFVEIHQLAKNGEVDKFRWSLDGGLTFVEEFVEIPAGTKYSLAHGLEIKFTNDDGHAVGDRWSFTGRPLHQIVRIEDVGSTAINVRLTRDNLEEAINEIASMGLLSVRSFTDSNYSNLYVTHTFERLIEDDVDLSGTALFPAGSILFTNNDLNGDGTADNIILSQASDPTRNQPFGITWEANTTGSFILFAVAEDSDGNRQNSNSTIVTVISSVGELPHVELGMVEESLAYSGSAVTASLTAEAVDPDGTIAEVSFYGNGVLIESDSTRPYSASFEINATGHYEVYAVARDNSGNLVTSNVRRIIVDEGGEEPEQPLVLSAPTAYLGGVGEISATYKSESGSYDSNIRALVYIDGFYAGDADLLPRTPPGPGEEDPGQSFTYDLLANAKGSQEVEFIIVNGDETANAIVYLIVNESPLSNDLEFIRALYQGLYARAPESFEIGQFYTRLQSGELTRAQLIEELRSRGEFVKARDLLIAHKTIEGEWDTVANALTKLANPYLSTNANGRPDDPELEGAGTFVTMNKVVNANIDVPGDQDWFRIQSLGPQQNGVLTVTVLPGHPGAELQPSNYGSPLHAYGPEGRVGILPISGDNVTGRGYGNSGIMTLTYDLREFEGIAEEWYFTLHVRGNAIESGPYTLVLTNELTLENEEDGEIFTSPVHNFDIIGSLGHLTSKFDYVDQFGLLDSHNPEEFFTRLFKNKYEQDAGPIQIARGVELLTDADGNFSQLQFLHDFALDNAILSVGPYNYTHDLAIPNVPLDAAAFAETALVYSALIGRAPSKTEVAKLTLTPKYELRPLAQRARMIMEMPDYAARYGLAMPEVDLPNLRNGREYDPGDPILIDATSLGADNLAGTADDGKIREIKVYLNGILQGSLSDGDVTAGTRYEFYQFNIPNDQPAGEYMVEVVAEDIGGLQSRASATIVLRSSIDVSITSPALGEKLYWNENVDFTFSSNSTVTSYLEVNGAIPWRGRLTFDGSDLPEDNSTLFIQDGTGRDPIVFEFDSDGSPGASAISTLVEMNAVKTGNISLSGTYLGTQARTYLIEIDSTSGPKDTFRWSIDGGANFNNSLIEITAGTPHSLSGGLAVIFAGDTNNTVGDRWRIEVQPQRYIVEVGRYGTFKDRLLTTKQNLISAINQVFNSGKLAIRAKSGQSGVSGGGGFGQYYDDYTIELCLDWVCAIIEDIVITPEKAPDDETTLLYNEDLPLITTTGTGSDQTFTLDVNKWLSPGTSMVKTRVVSIETGTGHVSYSSPRFYEVRNPHRPYVDLIYPQGRKAVLRFKETFSGGGLDASQIEIIDPGLGYEEESVQFSFLTADGSGGALSATLDEQGGISAISVVSSGSGYAQGDVIMASAPFRYRVGEEITVRAKLHDPLGETQGVTFYSNGVEIMETVEQYGNERVISFTPTTEQGRFICVLPDYGDGRDLPPRFLPDGSLDCDYSGKEHDRSGCDWGWRRCWEQQHCHPGQYVAPPWFWGELDGYWQWPPPWLSVDSIPGGLHIQPFPSSVTAELINPSPTDPTQNRFTLGVEVEIAVLVGAEVGTVEEVRLFLDGKLLDLDLRFPQAVPGSPVGSYSRDGIYGYVWTPARPGTYELTVQATDNAGHVSEITELSRATVVVDTETLGAPPVVRMTEPVPGGFGDTFPDYSYGSSLFINVLAYDPDGDLEYVKLYLNGEELGEPQGRFGNTYVYRWDVATGIAFFQNFVMQAVAKDNDGNVVRSGTLAGMVADNSANTRPTVQMDNVTVSNKGVELRALAEINDNTFFGGISRVQFFINGVTLDALGGEGSFFAEGLLEYVMHWKPERAGTYQIYAMAVGNVGHTGDHYTMSEPFEFELTEEHLALFASPNSGPNIHLVSPGPHIENQAIARAHLDESLTAVDENYGEITHISMISYGEDYKEEPEVSFFGGGGNGAKAEARIINGAITRVSLSEGGKHYDESLELKITPSAEFNGSQAKLEPVIRNGVITEIPILSKGLGYKSSDIVAIFDLQNAVRAGYGARAALVVDENGSVTSLKILNGGQDYDLNYLRVEVTGSGYGFEADMDSVIIEDGIIHEIVITDPGSGYTNDINYSIEKVAGTGGAGFGLDASINSTDVKDGVLMVSLTDPGTGYEYPPSVMITGGSTQSFGSPFVFTQGSIVTLEAEVEDTDGFVEEVRFYGNGQLLGNNPLGGIESLTIVNFGNPRSFSEPPAISFVGGGAGTGAEAQATLDANGTLIGVQITSPGVNYTSPPAVVISPSNGAVIAATVDTEIRNNARNIPGTNRWVADWNTRFAGTFNLSVEAIDDQSKSTRITTDRYITIIPQGPSKSPRATLLGPPDLRTYTSGSKLKLFAQASDLDGSLEWLQFYINGEPYGNAMPGNLDKSSARFPYSLDWEVPSAGVYSFFARVMDNSGNGAMTGISTITATTGAGELPVVEFREPLRVATADAVVNENGSISEIIITDGGFGYVKDPEIYISGGDGNAAATVELDLNNSSATYGQVIGINVTNGGSGYEENETYVSILKGFPLIMPGGESAIVDIELRPIEKQGTSETYAEWQPTFNIIDPGAGYIEAPTVVIEGLGTGMTAEAVIDQDRKIVTEINPTNNGTGYFQTGNKVSLEGGFPLVSRTFKANASDLDGSVVEVTLFVNGLPLQTITSPPYEFQWPTGAAGYYDVYFEVLDNQGNRNVSSVMRREVFHSEPPEIEFQPVSRAVVAGNVDENGNWGTGELLIQSGGAGYHIPPKVVFIDPNGSGSGAKGYAYLKDDKVVKVEITDAGSNYSQNSEIRLSGGLNSALKPVRLEFGKTLNLGIFADDPDSMINPLGFTVFINGNEDETISVTGNSPNFYLSWKPSFPGFFSMRVEGTTIEGEMASTSELGFEVYNEDSGEIELLGFKEGESQSFALGSTLYHAFQVSSKFGEVSSIRAFYDDLEVGSYDVATGEDEAVGIRYDSATDRILSSWKPLYAGTHDFYLEVSFTNGTTAFSTPMSISVSDLQSSLFPDIALTGPLGVERNSTTHLSTVRLEAMASDPDGNLEGVRFYVNGEELYSWSGVIDFTNLPADGDLLTMDDGTGRSDATTFEFDSDGLLSSDDHILVPLSVIDGGSTVDIIRTRNALERAMQTQISQGLLSVRTSTEASKDKLYLYHLMDRLIIEEMVISGTSLNSGNLILTEYSDNLIRRERSFGLSNYPFGMTWIPQAPGIYYIYGVATDKISQNQVMSEPSWITVTSGTGQVPQIKMKHLERIMTLPAQEPQANATEGNATETNATEMAGPYLSLELEANATDADGFVQQVAFYANGNLIGTDSSFPYKVSYEVNASGMYEFYAVASDDDGNDITSIVQRVQILETVTNNEPLTLVQELQIQAGGMTVVTAHYFSPTETYDSKITAHVYVDGRYAGKAVAHPRATQLFNEEDPGQKFTFELPSYYPGSANVEFIISNGSETASSDLDVGFGEQQKSPLEDDYEFLNSLWNGLFDRDAEWPEINAYLVNLRNRSMTRSQLIEELRNLGEFNKARNIQLAIKTIDGRWPNSTKEVLAKDENASEEASVMDTRPDDGESIPTATPVSMNQTIHGSIEATKDIDIFKIESSGNSRNDGVLSVTLEAGHPGVGINNWYDALDIDSWGLHVVKNDGSDKIVIDGSFGTSGSSYPESGGYERSYKQQFIYNLKSLELIDYSYYILVQGSAYRTGNYTLKLINTEISGFNNSGGLVGTVNSPVNDSDILTILDDFTKQYAYTNRYGQIGMHNPEEFFTRLFRNKYDQEPSPMQIARGVNILKGMEQNGTTVSQLLFLHDFALENNIITVGGYNYTTSEAQLAIPNVPIDAAAFAETALVYSALLGEAPTNAEVARLTLDPYFEVRPLEERARLIMEMPEYESQYGFSLPKVEIMDIRNGDILLDNQDLIVVADDYGPDDLLGTDDDVEISTISLLLNGKTIQQLDGGEKLSDRYVFSIGEDIPSGEYLLEVVATSVHGKIGRAHHQVFLKSKGRDLSITTPAHGEVLEKGSSVAVNYRSDKSLAGTSYLEINGNIRWSGMIEVNEEILEGNSPLELHDGTGREPVLFEWDTYKNANGYDSQVVPVRNVGDGNLTITVSSYDGPTEGVEFFVYIDGQGSQAEGKPDTFSWWEESSTFSKMIGQDVNSSYPMLYGVNLHFDSTSAFEYGDAWRIKITPNRNYVEVETDGSYSTRLASTKRNLIQAINQVNHRGESALRAYDPLISGNLGGVLPNGVSSETSIVLRHDGSYPIIEDVYASQGSTTISEDLFGLVKANSGGTLKISDWDAWELGNGLLELRVVHIAKDGSVSYSDRRNYPLVDPFLGYVELVGPIGKVSNPGRLPTIHFNDSFSDSLPNHAKSNSISIVDGGDGYRWYNEESKPIRVLSPTGSGGNLMVQGVDATTEAITEVYAPKNEEGSAYSNLDVILPSPPAFFALNEEVSLNARILDPQSDFERIAFYINGVELNSTVDNRAGGIRGTSFRAGENGDKFITARALYGDGRDFGPVAPAPFGQYLSDRQQYYGGKDYWGWKKSWLQQHYGSGRVYLPTWFNQHANYWVDASSWDHQAMWDGAAPVRIGEVDIYESVMVSINRSSPVFLREQLLHAQLTSLTATVEWEEGSAPSISAVYLYGNDQLLAEIENTENNNSFNRVSFDFDWLVNYKFFKYEEGIVDLRVVVVTQEGRQISSKSERVAIKPLSLTDPSSSIAMIYMDLMGEAASDSLISDLENNVTVESMAEMLKSIVDYSSGGETEYMADLIAAYHVLFGKFHTKPEDFFKEYDEWRDRLIADRTLNLLAYIGEQIISGSYASQYELIPNNSAFFFGTREGTNLGNRITFVKRHFKNKYGVDATPVQYLQGAQKMWQYAGEAASATNFQMNREAAVDFIYNLATETIEKVGLFGNITFPYINATKPLRPVYTQKASQMLLSKVSKENEIPDEVEDVIEETLQSRSFRRRFNLLWEDSETYEEFKNWKHEEWFGYFNDDAFPWIYHADLGWLYSSGTSHNNVWFYSPSMGWFWTNRETFSDHQNLTSETQRFIYRVRTRPDGVQEGSWSLITLLSPEGEPSSFHLHDYGYSSF